MGSQQLLLIVLGVIIVGIAVVVGISIFGSNADQANKDAMTQDALRMAAAAQGFYHKPTLLGGGGNSFVGITLADVGIKGERAAQIITGEPNAGGDNSQPNVRYASRMEKSGNENATYSIVGTATDCTISGTSKTVSGATITLVVRPDDIGDPTYTGF